MMLKQFLNPPNWFSAASLFCGLYAILLSGQAEGDQSVFYKAGLMIVFAGVFDMLDGRVARMTNTASQFGVQLDSLIDIVSFGIAPATMLYFWGLEPYGMPGVFVAFWFMICGSFRLARFNIQAEKQVSKYSTGLTITMAGGTLSVVIMFASRYGESVDLVGGVVTLALCMALLMVSSVPFRGLKTLKMSPPVLAGLVVFSAACLALGTFYDISAVLVTIGVLHVVSGPLEALVTWPRRRKARRVRAPEE